VKPDLDVKAMGPLFSGAIYGQMKRVITEIEEQVADEVVDTVQGIDSATFKNPTGHARSRVRKHRTKGAITVDRSRLIYGPWLEDGGSRSEIFSGYHAFEKTTRIVKPRVGDIADRIVNQYLIR
jgi:hypothetical protein